MFGINRRIARFEKRLSEIEAEINAAKSLRENIAFAQSCGLKEGEKMSFFYKNKTINGELHEIQSDGFYVSTDRSDEFLLTKEDIICS